ncbi:gp58-like family protein, partial [Niallia circulans]
FATQSQLTQTSNSLTSKISSVQTNLDNLEIGGRNLVKNTSKEFKTVTFGGWDYYFPERVMDWEKGMTLTGRIYLKPTNQEASIMLHVRYTNGTYTQYRGSIIKPNQEGYSVVTATIQNRDDISHIEYSIRHSSATTPSDTVRYKEAKVEKGNKPTDWSPAPEDMATVSQISQLSDAINLRVTKDDLMTQINLNPQGILIQGKNLILDGNTTVNGTFKVGNGNITSLDAGKVTTGTLDAAKVSVVNLNASNIKTGTLSGVRIISTASGDTTEITGGNISSTGTITRIFGASSIATYVSTFDSYNGVVRVGITSKKSNGVERVDSAGGRATMLTDKGITTQRAIHSGTSDKNGARFIDFFADETLTSGVQGLGMHI